LLLVSRVVDSETFRRRRTAHNDVPPGCGKADKTTVHKMCVHRIEHIFQNIDSTGMPCRLPEEAPALCRQLLRQAGNADGMLALQPRPDEAIVLEHVD
jgi:hypothetical protein